MTTTLATRGQVTTKSYQRLKALFGIGRYVRNRVTARRTVFDLSRLDERALRDIGIWRFEVPHATGHPLLWHWPR